MRTVAPCFTVDYLHHTATAIGEKLMVPLGTTINMDGTALYEAVAASYILTRYRVLTPYDLIITRYA